jgi:hypothetical protein
MGIAQQLADVGVGVGDPAGVAAQDQNGVLRRLEETPIADFGVADVGFQRLGLGEQ